MFQSLGKPGHSAFLQYKENEWKIGNQTLYDLADGDCSKCEALVSESKRLRRDVGDRAAQKGKEVERQFDFRLSDLQFWRTELDNQVAGLQRCGDLLIRLKTRMRAAVEACDHPIKICREVIVRRDARRGMDLVDDDPQDQIQKYLALLYDTKAVLNRTIDETEEQERANRAVTNQLMRDLEDKFSAVTIDYNANAKCRDIGKPLGLKFNEELLRPVKGAVTLSDWESWTKHNMEKGEHERNCSDKLRPLIEQILKQTYEDLDLQRRKVLRALNYRIKQLTEAQKFLEERLARINEQILEQKSDLDNLQLARDDKFNRLALCQSRMEDRRLRPRMELVWDSVQLELEREVSLLTNAIKNLEDKIIEGRELLKQMEQTQLGLEKQIEQKKDTLFIDQTCLNALAQISYSNF